MIKVGGTTEASSRGRPEIDRARLRQVLVDSLPEGTIRWNSRLRSVDANDLTLHFDHGVETGFDFLIGADGAWSKVRPVLTDVKSRFVGLGGYDPFVHDTAKNHPDLYKLVNRGSLFVYSDCKGITAKQRGDGTIIVYASGKREEDWKKTCGYDLHDANEVNKATKEEFKDWAEPLVKLTQVADDSDSYCSLSIHTASWTSMEAQSKGDPHRRSSASDDATSRRGSQCCDGRRNESRACYHP